MVEKLELVVNQFQCLQERSIEFLEDRYQEAWNALKHIHWWGVCLPTTCCYQYGMWVLITKLRCINSLCVLVLVLLTGSRTIGCIYFWLVYSHIVNLWLYILLMGGRILEKCPKVIMFS